MDALFAVLVAPLAMLGTYKGIGWFTLAFINVGIAQSKNRGSWSWFFLSLLLGPVATFLLVTFFDRKLSEDGLMRVEG